MESYTSLLSIARVMTVFVLVILGLMTSLPAVSARVDYNCVFGEMITSTNPEGEAMEFCPTHMEPAFMSAGQFIWAYKEDGSCYECICEPDFGLACCECPKIRRRG